jgi:hypothetical protein
MVILGALISCYLNLNEVHLWFCLSGSESQTKKHRRNIILVLIRSLRYIFDSVSGTIKMGHKIPPLRRKYQSPFKQISISKNIWIPVTPHSMITSKKSILNYRGFKSIKNKTTEVLTNYQWIQNCLKEAKEHNGNKEYNWRNINGQDLVQLFKIEILFTWWNICKQYASTQQVCPSPQFLLC